ncbi:DUF7507 domain-containing protein [Oricola sp.]|uniref:DUF7507 domain-containing protein n=1 Tax=Oricola sp. TaxID=1979950 RepID=UPI003BA94975
MTKTARKNLYYGTLAMALLSGPAAAQTLGGEAKATGTYDGQSVESPAGPFATDLQPLVSELVITASGSLDISGGEAADKADAGDTVTYAFSVTNNGNVAIGGVQPTLSVTAGDTPAEGEAGAFQPQSADIAAGETQEFIVAYRLAQTDILRAAGLDGGLSAAASVAGTGHAGGVSAETVANVSIDADPQLAILVETRLDKADGNSGGKAQTGDTVTYVYTVTNTGNVPISDVRITGALGEKTLLSTASAGKENGPWDETQTTADVLKLSDDASGTDGSWDVLGAGGAIMFTYVHTITQAEFEAQ